MRLTKRFGLRSVVASSVALAACAEPVDDPGADDAPTATTDTLDEQDQGTSYGGWTQAIYTTSCTEGFGFQDVYLTRTSGPSTRGAGSCGIVYTGAACTSDSTCATAAQAQYGSSAWGYCYSSKCYSRPGSGATYCDVNSNRAPGHYYKDWAGSVTHGLSCMTKAAGPSTNCGLSDPTLWVRTVKAAAIYKCL